MKDVNAVAWNSQNCRMVEVGRDFWRLLCPSSPFKQGHLQPVAQDCVWMDFCLSSCSWSQGKDTTSAHVLLHKIQQKCLKVNRLILFLVPSCWLMKDCGCISGEQNSSDQINPAETWGLLTPAQWNTTDVSQTLAGSRNEQSKLTLTWKILLEPKKRSWEELS